MSAPEHEKRIVADNKKSKAVYNAFRENTDEDISPKKVGPDLCKLLGKKVKFSKGRANPMRDVYLDLFTPASKEHGILFTKRDLGNSLRIQLSEDGEIIPGFVMRAKGPKVKPHGRYETCAPFDVECVRGLQAVMAAGSYLDRLSAMDALIDHLHTVDLTPEERRDLTKVIGLWNTYLVEEPEAQLKIVGALHQDRLERDLIDAETGQKICRFSADFVGDLSMFEIETYEGTTPEETENNRKAVCAIADFMIEEKGFRKREKPKERKYALAAKTCPEESEELWQSLQNAKFA